LRIAILIGCEIASNISSEVIFRHKRHGAELI
jgi:hypothetical protein